jgi:hypothetical protein
MPNSEDKRQLMILAVLATPAGDASARGDASPLWAWERLAMHLTPLIGEAGFIALYSRALRLAAPGFQWLTVKQAPQTIDALFRTLGDDFFSVESPAAAQANQALLGRLTALLSALIGDLLTMRILESAWGDATGNRNHTGDQQ